MWLLSWKKYKLSKGATFVSAIGALIRYGAILCVVSGLIPAFLICAAIGIGFHFWAESINNGKWQKSVTEQGYAARIASGDLKAAISVYNANPTESTLKFIATHHPKLAQEVRNQIKK